MKFEKRSDGAEDPIASQTPAVSEATPPASAPVPPRGKKPVIVYIMILFIVAFLLMALSFLMHQRSNSEAIGELRNSVNTLQQVQLAQDENLQLQKALDKLQIQRDELEQQTIDLENEIAGNGDAAALLQGQISALEDLYTLQQQFSARDLDACRETIERMEREGADQLLPTSLEQAPLVTSPAQRFLQLKEAVERN